MNMEEKQDRFLELEKKAIDNFLEVQMDLIGFSSIIIDYLDEDEQEEYYQLEKELYS
jgi:hypothetical protein